MSLNRLFTIFLVLFQLLFMYATPIPSFSVADTILLLFLPLLILNILNKQLIPAFIVSIRKLKAKILNLFDTTIILWRIVIFAR